MTEYNKMAKGSFISTGMAQIVQLPFQPDWVEFYNYTDANTAATSQNIISGRWDSCMAQGTAIVQGYNATPALIYDTVSVNGISTFSAGQLLQYGPEIAISTIVKATGVFTTTAAHGLKSGDVVVFQRIIQSATTGMPQLHNIPFTVTVTGATTFTIPWNINQSEYTDYDTATATQDATLKKVLYPYLYFPGVAFISAITLGATTVVDTTSAHNFVLGQEVAFRIPSDFDFNWGTTQLNSLPNTLVPGSPVYGYVIEVIDYNSVRVNIDSTAFTAFNSNPEFADVPGLSYPQIVAVGDVNTGGVQISAGSPLYPSPYYVPIGNGNTQTLGVFASRFNTINGPAIQGAFVNNTSQGFIIGAGAGKVLTTANMVGTGPVGETPGDRIHWRAYYHDISSCSIAPLILS